MTEQNKEFADSLAQTFTIPKEYVNGVFLTSIDLFFAELGTDTLPVFVKITETVNGYPSTNILKGATGVIRASDIVVDPKGLTPTKCRFSTLVYLEPSKEYAIKVQSNSIQYKLWISQMGEKRVDRGLIISEQPSTGSFFRSQNNSTWTADQLQDLKFRLYFARFNVSKTGQVNFTNSPLSLTANLPPNPFSITNGSPIVKVRHPNHGLTAGKLITFSGSSDTSMNATFTVTAVINSDRYVVTKGSNSSATDEVGGINVKVNKSIKFDSFNIQSAEYMPKNTGVSYTTKFTTDSAKEGIYTTAKAGVFNDLDSPRYVYSSENERTFLNNAKSLDVVVDLYSTDSSISPILNAEQLSIALVSNKLDNRTDATYEAITAESAATGASAESRYISVPVTLKETATNLKVMMSVYVPHPSTIELWYRTSIGSSTNPLADVTWTQLSLKLEQNAGLRFTEIDVEASDLQAFTEFQTKIVFKSTNSAKNPKVKDFRVIALS